MRNTIKEDKLTNTFASQDNMTGDAPTARTGLALCHRVTLDSVAHWCSTEEGRGWPATSFNHRNDKTKVHSVTPWLPTPPPPFDPTQHDAGDRGSASPCQDCALCGAPVRSKLASGFLGLCRCTHGGLKDTTRTSMTLVVREALCVHEGGAWALQGPQSFTRVGGVLIDKGKRCDGGLCDTN